MRKIRADGGGSMRDARSLNLVHYSRRPLRRLWSTYGQEQPMTHEKPCGLWASVDDNGDGWRDWCLAENFQDESLICQTQLMLTEPDMVLTLSTEIQVVQFAHEYGTQTRFGHAIDWREVAKDYKGIIIAPYQWSLRLSERWYYLWDCASGCFWDISSIEVGKTFCS